ncbi:MAG: 4-hydroxythreonine-4-phosphate dehydrogenase PdxA, partial [Candidatus Omnitrophica bacterium]|nr:4-hydroxythreonine-4-phosphate dehydrogenase PdxA [Candidatus Omnitrophota bacterium]
FSFGKISAEYGQASLEYLDKALELIKRGEIDCLVTCPLSKEAVNLAGIKFSGHTEYLAKRTKTRDVVMMLVNKEMRFSLVTRHIPLKKVSPTLNRDNLSKTIFITRQYLKKMFSIKEPRIIVCGVNPHASDNGLLGSEENKIIQPVIKKLKKFIKYLDGPLSADVAIYKAKQREYDCVIAMYHDQALIPLKLLSRDQGVNITLGLPFVRTSPLHGTAFDIAGTSLANPSSLMEAIKLAVKCALNQKKD